MVSRAVRGFRRMEILVEPSIEAGQLVYGDVVVDDGALFEGIFWRHRFRYWEDLAGCYISDFCD